MQSIIVLKNHFENNDTIVYKNWVLNGYHFFHKDNLDKVSKEFDFSDIEKQQILDALNGIGEYHETSSLVEFVYYYCNCVEVDNKLRQIIIDELNPFYAFLYCKLISNDPDMRRVLIDSKNSNYCYFYCKDISNDDDMRQVIINNNDADYAKLYCKNVSDDPDMRKVISQS